MNAIRGRAVKEYLVLFFFFFFLFSCSAYQDAYLQKAQVDFHSSGFLTYDIFQAVCTLELSGEELVALAGAVSLHENTGTDNSFLFVSLRKRFVEQCREQALQILVQERLRMEKDKVDVSEESLKLLRSHLQKFFPGKLVYESREAKMLYGVYRLQKKNLIYEVGQTSLTNVSGIDAEEKQ